MSEAETRRSPWLTQVALLIAFLIVTAVGVFTVVVPELQDDADEEETAEESESQAPADRP
ncbi:MAG: hypothetical protein RLO52_20345 [Sandaracinaceae bacterium]